MLQSGELPGWRDFERTIEATFHGQAYENKYIFDVLLPVPGNHQIYYGLDCKMRGLLNDVFRKGVVTIEVSNAAGEFWDSIKALGISEETYEEYPADTAKAILGCVHGWHEAVDIANGGQVVTSESYYLVLQWKSSSLQYQLFQYPIELPDADDFDWIVTGRRLLGTLNERKVFEWYGHSGGQLKYYPKVDEAIWHSDVFQLEPLPNDVESGLKNKAKAYFPDAWSRTESSS